MVIAGVHALLFADDAEAARAFLRDVLGFESVDAHDGWLIFALPPAELGVHPTAGNDRASGDAQLWLMCPDLEATMAELQRRGVEFTTSIQDEGFGSFARFRIPGAGEVSLYQPGHASPLAEFG